MDCNDGRIHRERYRPSLSKVDENEKGSLDGPNAIEDTPAFPHTLPIESRKSPYPASDVIRFPVPDSYVDWTVSSL